MVWLGVVGGRGSEDGHAQARTAMKKKILQRRDEEKRDWKM